MEEPARRADGDHSRWHSSTQCSNADCVEVAVDDDFVAMRDSKDRSGPRLQFSPKEWQAFVDGVRDGQFDLRGPSV